MNHLPELISDLGLILVIAAVVTLLFKALKQPAVLGYVVAGFLVGPYVPLVPTIKETKNLQIWGEIGVIFLLFSVGLEFSLRKLSQVGGRAILVGAVGLGLMMATGTLIGKLIGWTLINSVFLGGILAISSTSIIARSVDEMNLKNQKHIPLTYGILIFEDIFAIALLAILSTIAVAQSFSGWALGGQILKLGFFLVVWVVVGVFFLPALFERIRRHLNDETLLMVSIGLCLMMVLIATQVGFSPALGAFIMGMLLAGTREGRRIELLLIPVRNLFAAIFFVTVGMLINPKIVVSNLGLILLLAVLVIFGKFFGVLIGNLISGTPLKTSIQTGLTMAQIGEFSFIIATLGVSLKVMSPEIFPIAVAVSVLTMFLTPILIRNSSVFADRWIERIPNSFLERYEKYQRKIQTRAGDHVLGHLWTDHGIPMVINATLVVAATLTLKLGIFPFLKSFGFNLSFLRFAMALMNLLIVVPFLWSVAFGARSKKRTDSLVATLIRILTSLGLIAFVISQYSPVLTATGFLISIVGLPLVFSSRWAERVYRRFESRFLLRLKESEAHDGTGNKTQPELAPWDAVLGESVVSPNSEVVGKTLIEARLKERYGVMVTLIERGTKKILAPGQTDLLLPGDRLYLIGTNEQIDLAARYLEAVEHDPLEYDPQYLGLESVRLSAKSPLVGKSIRECGVREYALGIIVGLERKGSRLLNPDSSLVLQTDDVIWVVGDRDLIQQLE